VRKVKPELASEFQPQTFLLSG